MSKKGTANKLPDDDDRQKAIHERGRDVVILAGAGTGKTEILSSRFVELAAPENDGTKPLAVTRMAGITFTRKAAGEIKNRIREKLLLELDDDAVSAVRRERLKKALDEIDLCAIGTIHSFAERLLKLRPMEAGISPRFTVSEDTTGLIEETIRRWETGANLGDLAGQWKASHKAPPKEDLDRAIQWLQDLRGAGVGMDDTEYEHSTVNGIRSLVASIAGSRDKEPPVPVAAPVLKFDANTALLKALLKEIEQATAGKPGSLGGVRFFNGQVLWLEQAIESDSIPGRFANLQRLFSPPRLCMKDDFAGDKGLWKLFNAVKNEHRAAIWEPLALELARPLPAVYRVLLSLLEDVKLRRETVDQEDLLLKLRGILDKEEIREELAGRFDHIMVDEFQDTDPVQADIILALCQKAGSLTIIGDPKQSIYRFRRADIARFAGAVAALKKRHALETRLSTNFRSRPGLIDAFDKVFPGYFGNPPDGMEAAAGEFDRETGWVRYAPVNPSPDIPAGKSPPLRFLRLDTGTEKIRADDGRYKEARLLARYIRHLLGPDCAETVRDLVSGEERKIRGSDIAILARVTTGLGGILRELRLAGVEIFVSGGSEFAKNSLVKRFISVLYGLANPDYGPAQAALRQFPFSSATQQESLALKDGENDPIAAWFIQLRKERFNRPVLHTALDILEKSCALAALSVGPTADEDLAAAYRFVNLCAQTAEENGWGFDQAAAWAYRWLDSPPQMNTPRRSSDAAVNIITIHQAKGLEFPLVILFDGFSSEGSYRGAPFTISDDGKQWIISVGHIKSGVEGEELENHEKSHNGYEQKRLHYVAATRARDFLIIPMPQPVNQKRQYAKVWKELAGNTAAPYDTTTESAAASFLVPIGGGDAWKEIKADKALDKQLEEKQADALTKIDAALEPVLVPRALTDLAASIPPPGVVIRPIDGSEFETAEENASESGGAALGTAVHKALYLIVSAKMKISDAAGLAVAANQHDSFDTAAVTAHVIKAIDCLTQAGYLDGSWKLLAEVPFVFPLDDGTLLQGSIDLVAVKGGSAHVLDYKTEAEPGSQELKHFQNQVAWYKKAVETQLAGLKVEKARLLFTAIGEIKEA